jgi:acyl-CoA reductase-like NAD-dependent aldehyde dehydrogenase
MKKGKRSVTRGASRAISAARSGVDALVGNLPGALEATRAGARETASALQALPDPTLRWLAAASVGVGAGLFLAGKPRLVIAASVAPALAMGAAMVVRPVGAGTTSGVVQVIDLGPRGPAPDRVEWDLVKPRHRGKHA